MKNLLIKLFPFKANQAKLIFVIFYSVGALGLLNTYSYTLFSYLTPFALILTTFLLFRYHRPPFDRKTLFVFLLIFMIGYWIEVIGVKTGLIFGIYEYSYGLGFKFLDTPLMIGINWLILTYSFSSITAQHLYAKSPLYQSIIAAIGMTSYDIVIEQVADYLQMWHWKYDIVPIQNYLAWFILSLILQLIIKYSKIDTYNPISKVIIISHITFFGLIIIAKYFGII